MKTEKGAEEGNDKGQALDYVQADVGHDDSKNSVGVGWNLPQDYIFGFCIV